MEFHVQLILAEAPRQIEMAKMNQLRQLKF